MRRDKQRELTAHVVDWLSKIGLSNLIELGRTLPCPEFHSRVPSPTHNHRGIVLDEVIEIFDGLSVRAHSGNLIRGKIPLFYIIVGACKKYRWLIDAPA